MKAIRKSDGREIEVYLWQEAEYVEKNGNAKRFYTEDSLILVDVVDWKAFRREAAKDILAGMMSNVPLSEYGITDAECMAEYAVLYAEKLIKRLKNDEK